MMEELEKVNEELVNVKFPLITKFEDVRYIELLSKIEFSNVVIEAKMNNELLLTIKLLNVVELLFDPIELLLFEKSILSLVQSVCLLEQMLDSLQTHILLHSESMHF